MQSLNSSWFSLKEKSTSDGLKAVAYMLDTDIWTQEFTGNKDGNEQVEYVVGGPSIEQIFKAYNKKYRTNYSAKAFNGTGYKIKETPSEVESEYSFSISDMLKHYEDSTFMLGKNATASVLWIASPSHNNEYVMGVSYRRFCFGMVCTEMLSLVSDL